MMKTGIRGLLVAGCVAGITWFSPNAQARKEALLDITHGQQPSDTGGGEVFYSLAECKELNGQALKIQYPVGDSFGVSASRITNWKSFTTLEFSVFNPSSEKVTLGLNVKHQRSTSYSTRVDVPITIRPGRQEIKLNIADMSNTDGSAADLANVTRWYLANTTGKTMTLFFGDINLVGEDLPGESATGAVSSSAANMLLPGNTYHIRGTIGGQPVDLTVTAEITAVPGTASVSSPRPTPVARATVPLNVPDRLARIHAAKMPAITAPVMFNTPAADAIVSALEVFPPDNPWNQIVADWPLHPNSKNIIASIGTGKPLRCNPDMAYILIPPDQKRLPVRVAPYAAESDSGPFPVPDNTPVEGWPVGFQREPRFQSLTLDDVQRDKLNLNGDQHASIIDPVNRMLYEFYQFKKTDHGWQATQASIFDLKTNKLRPDGWTSTDAAGLPIFPAIVRYDELQRGMVEHAMRFTVRRSRRAYVAPATHFASALTDENLPRMGERLRLRRDFDVTGFSPEMQAILKGLKTYGMFVADNGIDWAISVAPDERIPVLHEELRRLHGSDFEVVVPLGR